MTKTIIRILIALSIISFSGIQYVGNTYAEVSKIKVQVTEKVPGADCGPAEGAEPDDNGNYSLYECNVEKGFSSVIKMFGNIIKYFTYIAGLGGVLFIVINGILYSMGGIDQSLKDESKKRIIGTIVGLVMLFLSGIILNLIAPWIYK